MQAAVLIEPVFGVVWQKATLHGMLATLLAPIDWLHCAGKYRGRRMSEAKDSLLRPLALLRLIHIESWIMATITLLEKLKDRGLSVTLRSVQRDLKHLSVSISPQCVYNEPSYRWRFTRGASAELLGIDAPTPLALYLSESHLSAMVHQGVQEQLRPHFRSVCNFLNALAKNKLARWAGPTQRKCTDTGSTAPSRQDTDSSGLCIQYRKRSVA